MNVSFLSPLAGLLAVAVAVPLAAFALTAAKERRGRRVLGLPGPPKSLRTTLLASLAAIPLLLALAATQPVVELKKTRVARTDAEAIFVFDTSRSMLASLGPNGRSRFARAEDLAIRLRSALPEIPVGVASMTDRTLPHLLPTLDEQVFSSVVRRVIGIEKPPPGEGEMVRITTLGALSNVATRNFFAESSRHRLVVLFSDDESDPYAQANVVRLFSKPPGIKTIFVRFWNADERIYTEANLPEAGYQPDPASAAIAAHLASAIGGRALGEKQYAQIVATARRFLGNGPRAQQPVQRTQVALAPYVSAVAVLPLALLLWRRNLG